MSNMRELKQLREEAEDRGWKITKTNGGHLKWTAPKGGFIYTALTPSDRRAVKNIRAMMKRVEAGRTA